jgi:2-hydroxy-3-keto-5-methylthiopentenyl-1-phosphate phosphatase
MTKQIMREIYELKKSGKTWKEIQELLKQKISISKLIRDLKSWCIENNEKVIDCRKGNKRAGRPKKTFELQEKIMELHEKSGKFGK